MIRALLSGLILLPFLGACGSRDRAVDTLDRDLLNSAAAAPADRTDPALTSALADQIMVDPALTQQAGGHGVRAPDATGQAPLPPDLSGGRASTDRPTLGELARRHAAGAGRTPRPANCYADLFYSQNWANKLPAAVPLPTDATVSEAAGNDIPGCRTRVVSYASGASANKLAAFYAGRAKAGGYDAGIERRGDEIVVAGDHRTSDAAFFVSLDARPGGGTDVDMVTTGGR